MAPRRFLVTAALPYSNGRLHVGHIAGAYLPADTWVRYLRLRGDDVRFICGSDDNGVTALIAARKEGKTPEELTARYNARQAADFRGMGIEFDVYGGTHQPGFVEAHEALSQDFFRSLHAKGCFVKKSTLQLYDAQAQQFLPDRYVKGKCYHKKADGTPCGYAEAYGDQCESCGQAIDALKLIDPVSTITGARPEPRETTHWHLQLGAFEEPLRQWLESKREAGPGAVPWREMTLNFSLGQVKGGLPERAMTRDLSWGVPVPLDDPDARGKVLYVWFDAPVGYVSFTEALLRQREGKTGEYARWWKDPECRIVHFIGEDNTIFHTLIWPAMLMAEGTYQLPWQVVVNQFLNIKFPGKEEEKISKSRGTAIWIEDYLNICAPDPLRYYLTAIAPESARTAFDADDFIARNNGELGNALGNFINRTLAFAHKYLGARVPEPGERHAVDSDHLLDVRRAHGRMTEHFEHFRFKQALGELMGLARASNVYFDLKQPWKQAKENPPGCATSINVCIQTVKALATMMAPILPFASRQTLAMLNVQGEPRWDEALDELPAGGEIAAPRVLFKRLDAKEMFG